MAYAIFSCISSLPFDEEQEYLLSPSLVRVVKAGESGIEEALKIMARGCDFPYVYDPRCYWNWSLLIAPIEDDKSPVFREESDYAVLTLGKDRT